ncbi:MAG: creatininase family protein [Firmicutes bacterium]|nr:creatininase family protein [Bacillota bacterium]
MWLHHNSWDEASEYLKRSQTIIIPVGSIEQHGEHLPLGTDTMVAEAIAESVAEEAGVLVAPAVSYGWSPHHMVLTGTVTIRPEILIEYLYDVIESLSKHGFKKFLLLNGHRIVNISWMQIAGERAKRQLEVDVLIADPAFLSKELARKEGMGLLGHADELETSHMLYVRGDFVQLEKARDFTHQRPDYKQVDPRVENDMLCYIPSTEEEMEESVQAAGGTSGRPTKSTVEFGNKYHDWVVSKLVTIINEWQDK